MKTECAGGKVNYTVLIEDIETGEKETFIARDCNSKSEAIGKFYDSYDDEDYRYTSVWENISKGTMPRYIQED